MASKACRMWCWSFSGSFASDFLAGPVTSSLQFIVEGVKGDEVTAFVGGAAFGDGLFFCLRRRVEREAAFIRLRGCVDCDRALANGERDQISWLDTGFLSNGLGDREALFFHKYSHEINVKDKNSFLWAV